MSGATTGHGRVGPRVVLSISGSDSGAGAGAQADLKTYGALGVYGTTAITVLTAQNTAGVRSALPTPPSFVVEQAVAVLDDLDVAAVKTGFLATEKTVTAVVGLADSGRLPRLVVDPVLVSSTGAAIMPPAAIDSYRHELAPRAAVLTPNVDEAALLLDRPISNPDELRRAAEDLGAMTGAGMVVVKGGRLAGFDASDAVWSAATGVVELPAARVATPNDHGTGCSFAAATAARLAHGDRPLDAVRAAKAFVDRAITSASTWRLGAGHGPIDHFA